MSTTERDDSPWTWTGDRFENHYGHPVSGGAPESMDEKAARDWYQHGGPQDGERFGEHFVQDGQLWNDGKYLAEDGAAEPYRLFGVDRYDPAAEVELAHAESEAQNDGWAR